jgi:hypothetical protein
MPDPDWDSLKAELEPIVDQYIAAHPEVLSAFQSGGAETLAATATATTADGRDEDDEDLGLTSLYGEITDEDFEVFTALESTVDNLIEELISETPEEIMNEISELAGVADEGDK